MRAPLSVFRRGAPSSRRRRHRRRPSGAATDTLTIAPHPLSLVASNANRFYGEANPVFGGTITGASFGAVVGSLVKLHDMTIVDVVNFAAIAFKRIEVRNSHIENAPNGLESAHIRLDGATLDNAQVWTRKAELTSSSVTNGQFFGVQARDTRLTASSVTGNGINARCGVDVSCADLMAGRRLRLDVTSTCGTSLIFDDSNVLGTWGVCSLD